jgi:NADH-quinone oxidoreductase subunit N
MIWTLFYPELYFLAVVLVFLAVAMRTDPNPERDFYTALALAAVGICICLAGIGLQGTLFEGTYRVDLFSQVFKVLLAMGLFLIFCLCPELKGIHERHHPEFYLLLAASTLAMMMMVSCVHLVTLYAALELSSYSLYCLVFLRRDRKQGIAAGLKYFLFGATASAVMLFGIALLYGSARSLFLTDMLQTIPGMIHQPDIIIGLILTLGGLFFKLAVFPFHFWAPGTYEGAANQVAAFIATASKVAALAILMRLVALSGGLSTYLAHGLAALAIISMTVGNLTAIVQKDLKRLLAYSSIAHAGYSLLGILSMNHSGYSGTIFYALAILILKFSIFLVVIKVASDGANLNVSQLAGLHRRSPLLALTLMLALFGLAGIPPTIGFTGKFLIFTAAMQKGYFVLVLIAMINVVISLYYYLLILKAAYLLEPAPGSAEVPLSPYSKTLAGILIGAMIFIGLFPSYFIELARSASSVLL